MIFIKKYCSFPQNDEKIRQALNILRAFKALPATQLPPLDDSHIPEMSPEEQAEIETSLDSMTDEDREIVETRTFELEL